MQIDLEVSEHTEMTESPYWLILDPKQNMSRDVESLAAQITGPYFSREEAEAHLKNRRYAFSSRAVVYAHSGCWAEQYREKCRFARGHYG